MVVLDIDMSDFKDAVETALAKSDIKGFMIEAIIREAEARMSGYLADTGNGEVISNNLIVTLGELLIILRNHHIEGETEAFIMEDLHKFLLVSSENNPYM